MIKDFYNLYEIQKYYDEKSNTYIFKESGEYIELVVFKFNLNVNANIDAADVKAYDIHANNIDVTDIRCYDIEVKNITANNITAYDIEANDIDSWNIKAHNIKANNIDAENIEADSINANDISYLAVCFAYNDIECKTIKGRMKGAKHFVLWERLAVEENEQ